MNRWRAARSAWWVRWLLLALLWLPLMGALHQVAHGGASLQAPSASPASVGVVGASGAGPAHSHASAKGLAGFFFSHGSDADCLVFDQLSHGACLSRLAAPALPALPSASFSRCRLPAPPGLLQATPQARGPPELA